MTVKIQRRPVSVSPQIRHAIEIKPIYVVEEFEAEDFGSSCVAGSTPFKTSKTARHFAVRFVPDLASAEV